MRAMAFTEPGSRLKPMDLPRPEPGSGQILIKIEACGVCRTDLHIIDGELPRPKFPLVLGHEIVGRVAALGSNVAGIVLGERVGVPWLGHTCGVCEFCRSGAENLCDAARFTGYDIDGGYAEYCVADHHYCFSLPDDADPVKLAPLMCAGLIGYRSLRLAGDARQLGIYGFGAAAHLVAQVAIAQGRDVYAFTKPGDREAQALAMSLGCKSAQGSDEPPPHTLDAALIFAPAGELIPKALGDLRKGGCVVCGGIHMSPIPSFSYDLLWGERSIRSVANLTRQDGAEFLKLAASHPFEVHTTSFPLEHANKALSALRMGQVDGAAVLVP